MRILITAANSADAYKIERLLQPELVVFADCGDVPAFSSAKKKMVVIPAGNHQAFAHQLLGICLDNDIQYVLPLRKEELAALAESAQLFAEYGINIVLPERAVYLDYLDFDGIPQAGGQQGIAIISNGILLGADTKGAELVEQVLTPELNGVFKLSVVEPQGPILKLFLAAEV